MANLIITSQCSKHCSYCFADAVLNSSICNTVHMPMDLFEKALKFLKNSGISQVRFLGGEPTLHPDFTKMLHKALKADFNVLLFSNGNIAENVLKTLEQIPKEQISVLINLDHPDDTDLADHSLSETFLRLNNRIIPGINIYKPGTSFDFILKLIKKFNFSKIIRFGLAHPDITGKNIYLRPVFYDVVGLELAEFALRIRSCGIKIEFDCGFVPCMFPENSHTLFQKTHAQTGQRCSPIPDLLPNGRFIPCFPLGDLKQIPLKDSVNNSAEKINHLFSSKLKPLKTTGIYKKCSVCEFMIKGECSGGCRAVVLKRFTNNKVLFSVPEKVVQPKKSRCSKTTKKLWTIPYIDQPFSFWAAIEKQYRSDIKEVYVPFLNQESLKKAVQACKFPVLDIGSGRPGLPQVHLPGFLNRTGFRINILLNPVITAISSGRLLDSIIYYLSCLYDRYNISNITITDQYLAMGIKKALPQFNITASVVMDICSPAQIKMLGNWFDTIVISTRIMRDFSTIKNLAETRGAFDLKLIVNESCLPGCIHRVQHFYDMTFAKHPESLCRTTLEKHPWMRLTGSWVLPQHLYLYDSVCTGYKLAGRVTLQNPESYLKVLNAYINRTQLSPEEIGGGPASVLNKIHITEEFFKHMLMCDKKCTDCNVCKNYYENGINNGMV